MKKIIALLIAASFGLSAAMPVTAAPAEDGMAIVPASKPAKVKKAKTVKKLKAAKKAKKPLRARKHVHRH